MTQQSNDISHSVGLSRFNKFFFLGIGGIGMSAIARFFKLRGGSVSGYDRTPSALTHSLESEGIAVSYTDSLAALPAGYDDPCKVLVVRTPAVPQDSVLLQWLQSKGYMMMKRAEVLGLLTRDMRSLCVAGTHGKTTTSTMLAHLLHNSEGRMLSDVPASAPKQQQGNGVNAFLGGISVNYGSNFLHSDSSDIVVVEADEYDRSFHHLRPTMAIVTSTDPDHLDIYGSAEAYRESFAVFTSLIKPGGVLLRKAGITLESRLQHGVRELTYGVIDAYRSADSDSQQGTNTTLPDYYADNIVTTDGEIRFDFHGPQVCVRDVSLGVPVWVNIENAVAAMTIALLNGVTEDELREGMASFRGTLRRFNTLVKTENTVLIDDYAHHPDELRQSICSVRRLYPGATLTGVFQPHLYTRTRDFYKQFAASLSLLDRLILLPIYPARELPIDGVTSELILKEATLDDKELCDKTELPEKLRAIAVNGRDTKHKQVIMTLGAGDIDRLLPDIVQQIEK